MLVGNTYTSATPFVLRNGTWRGALRVHNVDQQIVPRASIPDPDTTLPPTPPNLRRKIFEVTGTTAAAIQAQIDAAAQEEDGTRPVVHLARGVYGVGTAITVPAGKDLQLIGDGAGPLATHLSWTGGAGGPLMLLEGPSRAVLRDFTIDARTQGARVPGLVVTNADQPGGRIYANQLIGGGETPPPDAATKAVYVDGIENADVTLLGFGFAHTENGLVVRGGPARSSGGSAPGQVTALGGATSHAGVLFDVLEGGELLAGPAWYEESSYAWPDAKKIDLHSSGSLTVLGLKPAAPFVPETPMVQVHGHRGVFSLISGQVSGGGGTGVSAQFLLDGDGSGLTALSVGTMLWAHGPVPGGEAYVWLDRTSPAADASLLQCALNGAPNALGYQALANVARQTVGATPADASVRAGLALLRNARIEPPNVRAPGATDLKIFRVGVATDGASSIELRR